MKNKSLISSFFRIYATSHLQGIPKDYSWLKLLLLAMVLPVSGIFSQVETKISTVENFDKIKVSKDYRVILVADQSFTVTIEGLRKDIEKVKFGVKNGELSFGRKGLFGTKRKVFIYVGVDSISSIRAKDDAVVESSGTIHSKGNLNLRSSNDARIYVQTDAYRVLTDSGFYSSILVKLIAENIKSDSVYDPKTRKISQSLVVENK